MNNEMVNKALLVIALCILTIQLMGWKQNAEAVKQYQYKVVAVTGMTELKKESNSEQGRVREIEKVIQQQAGAGWELLQADGYVLYFRR